MPNGVVHGRFIWPGVQSVEGGKYVLSHGTSAGIATLTIHPQDISLIQPFGDLVITDDVNPPITVPGCRVKSVKADRDSGGQVWHVTIEDRRWRWQAPFGHSELCANQRDLHNKLLPWTLRSPTEIAEQLLRDLGEVDWAIDLPDGLGTADAVGLTDQLQIGENYPPAGKLNSAINLDWENPARALSSLCDMFGRRPYYNLGLNRLEIAIPGTGAGLPVDGSIDRQSQSVEVPAIPPGIMVVGDRTKFQSRAPLYAVGMDWDDSIVPIDQLSYAPDPGTPQPQIVEVSIEGTVTDAQVWTIAVEGVDFDYASSTGDTTEDVANALTSLINASTEPAVDGVVTAAASQSGSTWQVVITGVEDGESFIVLVALEDAANDGQIFAETTQYARAAAFPWQYSAPPGFYNVQAVEGRLTYHQAVELAQRWVWRAYRIGLHDPADRTKQLTDPFGREIVRRQQVVLTDTQAEQQQPSAGLANTIDKRDPKQRKYIAEVYNGYSRDLPAMVYGSVANRYSQFMYVAQRAGNSPENSRVMVPFEVVPDKQLIIFREPVYKRENGAIVEPDLVLETGYYLRDAESNAIERFALAEAFQPSVDTTGFATYSRPDIQRNVIALYENEGSHARTGVKDLEADPHQRAAFYLAQLKEQFYIKGGGTAVYLGLRPIFLTGLIQQVTWSFGPGGCETTASTNNEHETQWRTYPERRRAELLPPALEAEKVQAKLNPGEMNK